MEIFGTIFLTVLIFLCNYQINGLYIEKTDHYQSNAKEYMNETTDTDLTLLSVKPIPGYRLIIPAECEKIGICENIPNYPQEYIIRIIKRLLRQNIRLHNDPVQESEVSHKNIENMVETVELCSSETTRFYPEAARDAQNTWHLVLNTQIYPQSFVGERCKKKYDDITHCSKIATFPNNYQGECTQKYIKRKMIGLDVKMEHVVEIIPVLPSCCSCSVVPET